MILVSAFSRTSTCSQSHISVELKTLKVNWATTFDAPDVNQQDPPPPGVDPGILTFENFFLQSPHPDFHLLYQNPFYFQPQEVGISSLNVRTAPGSEHHYHNPSGGGGTPILEHGGELPLHWPPVMTFSELTPFMHQSVWITRDIFYSSWIFLTSFLQNLRSRWFHFFIACWTSIPQIWSSAPLLGITPWVGCKKLSESPGLPMGLGWGGGLCWGFTLTLQAYLWYYIGGRPHFKVIKSSGICWILFFIIPDIENL